MIRVKQQDLDSLLLFHIFAGSDSAVLCIIAAYIQLIFGCITLFIFEEAFLKKIKNKKKLKTNFCEEIYRKLEAGVGSCASMTHFGDITAVVDMYCCCLCINASIRCTI